MKQRNSSVELLRIIATLFVLIIHASFMTFNIPTYIECHTSPLVSINLFFTQSCTIICSNVFVLIAGWFGIRYNINKLCNILFQVLFYTILVYIILLIFDFDKYFNLRCASVLLLLNNLDLWFIKAYIGLMLFSPVLNAFADKASEKDLRNLLITFYIFQTIYGWASVNGVGWLGGGYSAVSFMGLYLLARYIYIHGEKICSYKASFYFLIYISITIIQTISAFVITYLDIPIAGRLFVRTNPLIILQSVAFLLIFTKFNFYNKTINWIGASCFSAYLIHSNPLVLNEYYVKTIRTFSQYGPFLLYAFICIFIFTIFYCSILIDQIRIFIWDKLNHKKNR